MTRAILAALLLTSCATIRPPEAVLAQAEDCTAAAPCSRTEGVWMPEPTANELARRALAWRECRAELVAQPDRVAPWVWTVGAFALGAVGGGVAVAATRK